MIGNYCIYATINRFASVLKKICHYIFQKLDSKTAFFLSSHRKHCIHWCHALFLFSTVCYTVQTVKKILYILFSSLLQS